MVVKHVKYNKENMVWDCGKFTNPPKNARRCGILFSSCFEGKHGCEMLEFSFSAKKSSIK